MPSTSQHGPGAELEIKLALPTADPASLARQLARLPALARRKPVRKQVDNIYFDTPAQALRAQRMALRLRRVGGDDAPQWLQTFKTSDGGDSALSLRGEWEVPVPGPALVQAALQAAPPWQRLDPEGAVFAALQPCFATAFERTAWTVRRRDGSVIEVALDLGQITSGQRSVPICELELELLAGAPTALFDLARHIALHIAVLPLAASKAQRGHALRDGTLDTPLRARPQPLGGDVAWHHMVQPVLGEMFAQFTANLNALRHCDDPELVHQAWCTSSGSSQWRKAFRLAVNWANISPSTGCTMWCQATSPPSGCGRARRGVSSVPSRSAWPRCALLAASGSTAMCSAMCRARSNSAVGAPASSSSSSSQIGTLRCPLVICPRSSATSITLPSRRRTVQAVRSNAVAKHGCSAANTAPSGSRRCQGGAACKAACTSAGPGTGTSHSPRRLSAESPPSLVLKVCSHCGASSPPTRRRRRAMRWARKACAGVSK